MLGNLDFSSVSSSSVVLEAKDPRLVVSSREPCQGVEIINTVKYIRMVAPARVINYGKRPRFAVLLMSLVVACHSLVGVVGTLEG